MKCCPHDNDLKEEWKLNLEHEVTINENEIGLMCDLFKVLSNPIRLKIAYHLSKQDYCVRALVYVLGQKQNLVSHHLSIMKQYGVVESFKQSRYIYYRLNPNVRIILDLIKKI